MTNGTLATHIWLITYGNANSNLEYDTSMSIWMEDFSMVDIQIECSAMFHKRIRTNECFGINRPQNFAQLLGILNVSKKNCFRLMWSNLRFFL